MSKILGIIGIIAILLSLSIGCTPTTNNQSALNSTSSAIQSTKATKITWQDQVTHAWVVAHSENWNADAEDDGIRVWIELWDKNDQMVEYSNTNMIVKIELYATESKTYPMVAGRLLYTTESVATGWEHDAFVTGAMGIKDISWQEISKPLPAEDQEIGIIYVTVTLPNGNTYSARYDEAEITPGS